MSKGVMPKQTKKTRANITEELVNEISAKKAEAYANYSNHELANMISNISDELQEETRRLDNLYEETEAYKHDLDSAYNSYKEEQQAMQEHLAHVQRVEEQVKNLSDVLANYTNAFTSRMGKK